MANSEKGELSRGVDTDVDEHILKHDVPQRSPPVSNKGITNVRRAIILIAIAVSQFLITIEITIVNTSLIPLANAFSGFDRISWVVTAYLLTYVGFLVIIAKFGDLVGLKLVVVASLGMFTLWSGICGAAQTETQLIIFRAFQGIGAAGVYSSTILLVHYLYPPQLIPKVVAALSAVLALALVLGPIFGGAITHLSTWRWIFLLNVPIGVIAELIFILLLPRGFPTPPQGPPRERSILALLNSARRKMDFLGAFLLLGGSSLLVAALENAGLRRAWNSAQVAGLLTISGVLFIAFLIWQRYTTKAKGERQPVLPWRFVNNRVSLGFFLTSFLLGPPSIVAIFSIPQRFQVVNGASALEAGLRLLPYTAFTPVSSMVVSSIASRFKVPPIYLIIGCSILQTVGFALLSTTPITTNILSRQYGYQILAAFGCGGNMTLLTVITRHIVAKQDLAVAQGAVGQLRYMGGVIGVAIATCVLNSYVASHLHQFLSDVQIHNLLQSNHTVGLLPHEVQDRVKLVFASAYNIQMRILIGFSVAQIPASLLMWRKDQVVLGVTADASQAKG